MQVLRDQASISTIDDPELRTLIEKRVQTLAEFDDYELHELVNFLVVEPGDALHALDMQLGFPILQNRFDGSRFGDPGFTPSFDLLEEHAGCYEIVFVVSDDGFGIEVFVAKDPGVPSELLAMCVAYATPAESMP